MTDSTTTGRLSGRKMVIRPFNDKILGVDSAGLEVAAAEGGRLQEVSHNAEGTARELRQMAAWLHTCLGGVCCGAAQKRIQHSE